MRSTVMKLGTALLLLLGLSHCTASRGFDRGALHAEFADTVRIDDEEIARVLDLRPQLREPFRLAVHFVPPRPNFGDRQRWIWSGEDKDALLSMVGRMRDSGVVSDMFLIGDALVPSRDRKSIRLAAARAGADAVLIVNGVAAVDRYNNALAATYLLLVTPLFVPGTVLDVLFVANASVWDVRNDFLYLAVESEATSSRTAPPAFLDEALLLRETRADALRELEVELLPRLLRIAAP